MRTFMVADRPASLHPMESRLYRAAVFALYQCSLLAGIFMLPIALIVRKAGLDLPVHRLVVRLGRAYERAAS